MDGHADTRAIRGSEGGNRRVEEARAYCGAAALRSGAERRRLRAQAQGAPGRARRDALRRRDPTTFSKSNEGRRASACWFLTRLRRGASGVGCEARGIKGTGHGAWGEEGIGVEERDAWSECGYARKRAGDDTRELRAVLRSERRGCLGGKWAGGAGWAPPVVLKRVAPRADDLWLEEVRGGLRDATRRGWSVTFQS